MIRKRNVFLGLALGWLFSSSVFVNNSVKVVSNTLDFERDDNGEERKVSLLNYVYKKKRC